MKFFIQSRKTNNIYSLNKKIFIILSILTLISRINLFNIEKKIKFEHLSSRHGLSGRTVNCIFQDKTGFLWIGTENGLNRYDGYKIITYKSEHMDNYGLSLDEITTIYEDSTGKLWIGTRSNGLNKYDQKEDKFYNYKYVPNNNYTLSNNKIRIIFEDHLGVLWIGTNGGGLNRFDRETEKFYHYNSNIKSSDYISSDYITSIYEDRDGIIWIGTEGGGLNRFDRETEKFYHYKNAAKTPYSLSNNNVSSIVQDNNGELWIGTEGGLNRFDRETEKFYHYNNAAKISYSLSNNNITSIFQDNNGVLWIGTSDGLYIYDAEEEIFRRYEKDINTPFSLSHNKIKSIYQDHSGIIWIGTDGGGLNKFTGNQKKFQKYYNKVNKSNYFNNNKITSIFEDKEGILWIGTENEGLKKFDRIKDKVNHYKNEPDNFNSLSDNYVTSIYEDHDGFLWIGTESGGLNKFDRKTERFYHYKYNPNDPYSLSNDYVTVIFEDHTGILWIGTNGGGLNKFYKETGRFYRYKYNPPRIQTLNKLQNNEITSIYEDNNSFLWIGTNGGGLYYFNQIVESFICYKNDYNPHSLNNDESLSNNDITSIYKDYNNQLWIGTSNGLNKFNRKNNIFYRYMEKDGFHNDFIIGILEDNQGFFWLSTENGISKFDPKLEKICNYNIKDGLRNEKYIRGAYFKNSKGEIFFGGTSGLDIFNPEEIEYNQTIPNIVIVDFKIFNKSILSDNRINLNNSTGEVKTIELRHKENVFTFEFAALDFIIPERNQYAYKMEGFDKEWIYSGTKNSVTYTNLNPGKYTFRVKGSNGDYIWNESGTSIKIRIKPPYWRTWWFYMICIIILFLMFFIIYNLKTNQLKAQNQALILQNKIKVSKKYQEQLKRFISDVSHELKTPLSIMRLSIEPVASSKKLTLSEREKLDTTLEMIYSMDFLVKKLLLLSKVESDNLQFILKRTNLNDVLKKVYDTLNIFAKEKKINFKLNLLPDNIFIKSDKDLLFVALFNIVENAIKYTEKGHVFLFAESTKDNIRIIIEDTGIGMSKEEIKKIFNRFYRGSYSRKQTKGYGIGLSITKRIIEIHNGKIEVESNINKKTKFIVFLPD